MVRDASNSYIGGCKFLPLYACTGDRGQQLLCKARFPTHFYPPGQEASSQRQGRWTQGMNPASLAYARARGMAACLSSERRRNMSYMHEFMDAELDESRAPERAG